MGNTARIATCYRCGKPYEYTKRGRLPQPRSRKNLCPKCGIKNVQHANGDEENEDDAEFDTRPEVRRLPEDERMSENFPLETNHDALQNILHDMLAEEIEDENFPTPKLLRIFRLVEDFTLLEE